jgi:hypothetical protein
MAIKTKKRNSSLAKRARISYASRDQGGSGSRVINWKEAGENVQFYQPAMGRNAINIIPYKISSKNHPLVKQGQMEIGELDYCLDIWVHRNVGPSESSVVCLKKTYGKSCPICEEAEKLKKAGKEKEALALSARRRVFYNVEDIRKKSGELQIFEVSHYLFEKELIDEARSEEEGDESFIDFADIKNGSEIHFRCSKQSQGGFEFNEYKSFSFRERNESIDDNVLEAAISFDKFMNVLSYEKLQEILFGADDDEDEGDDEEKLAKKKLAGKKPVRKSDDEDEEEEGEEDDNDEDDEPAKKTVKKSSVKPKRKPAEDDEDKEDEKPSKKSSAKKAPDNDGKKLKCPHGHVFGKDCDEHDECEDCDLWAKCVGAKK